jgi:hypothetical protein
MSILSRYVLKELVRFNKSGVPKNMKPLVRPRKVEQESSKFLALEQ